MLSEKPIHIVHRSWLWLGLAVILCFFGVWWIYTNVTGPPGSMSLNETNVIAWALWFSLTFGLAFFPAYLFQRSKKIEFFQDYVRVHFGLRLGTVEAPYDGIHLGKPFVRSMQVGFSAYFKMNFPERKLSVEVQDGTIRKLNTSLYYWLTTKIFG